MTIILVKHETSELQDNKHSNSIFTNINSEILTLIHFVTFIVYHIPSKSLPDLNNLLFESVRIVYTGLTSKWKTKLNILRLSFSTLNF